MVISHEEFRWPLHTTLNLPSLRVRLMNLIIIITTFFPLLFLKVIYCLMSCTRPQNFPTFVFLQTYFLCKTCLTPTQYSSVATFCYNSHESFVSDVKRRRKRGAESQIKENPFSLAIVYKVTFLVST